MKSPPLIAFAVNPLSSFQLTGCLCVCVYASTHRLLSLHIALYGAVRCDFGFVTAIRCEPVAVPTEPMMAHLAGMMDCANCVTLLTKNAANSKQKQKERARKHPAPSRGILSKKNKPPRCRCTAITNKRDTQIRHASKNSAANGTRSRACTKPDEKGQKGEIKTAQTNLQTK